MSEAAKEAAKKVVSPGRMDLPPGRLGLPKEAVTSGRLGRLAAEPEAMQAALRQAWAAKPEATQAQALRHAAASKVSPREPALTLGCLVHHQPKGDSWLKLRGQGGNQAMTSGRCYQLEMKRMHIQACTPFLPQAILQHRCGAVLLPHPTTHPPNKWKSVQLSNCF